MEPRLCTNFRGNFIRIRNVSGWFPDGPVKTGTVGSPASGAYSQNVSNSVSCMHASIGRGTIYHW